MMWTMISMLMALWLLGVASSYTLGGWIHLLLLGAVVIVIVDFIFSRKRAL